MIIAIDIDGVIADLHVEWYRRYNRDYSDDLKLSKVTDWSLHKFVKPECGAKIYDYLVSPDLYDNVLPIEGALEAVEWLRGQGNRVVFVSACVPGSMDSKARWMIRHGFVPEVKGHPEGLILTSDKDLIRAQILIDDGPKNIEAWPGLGIVYDAPYNKKIARKHFRIEGWKGLPVLWEELYA